MGRLSDKPQAVSRHKAKTKTEKSQRRKATHRRYELSPRGRYRKQKSHAKRRGIVWEITFTEWCEVWEVSGHWDERGCSADGFVMGRFGDEGPYAFGNVEIVPLVMNASQANETKRRRRTPLFTPDEDWHYVHSAEGID